jgi:NADH:ubiquinone oxidoreductase subunit E
MDNFIKKIEKSKYSKEDLLPILQDFQNQFGYIDLDFIEKLSKTLNIPSGKIYGIASFYSQFRFKPLGKYHIKLCSGASCHIITKEDLVKDIFEYIKNTPSGINNTELFSIELIPCMGACAQGPVMSINDKYFTKLTSAKLKEILKELTESKS